MSLIGDLVDGVLEGTGWAAGVAVVLGVAAVGARRDSPVVKEIVKGYLMVSDRVKELVAEAGEQLADLYAEARAEYESGTSALATLGAPAAAAAAAPATATRRRGRPPRSEAAAPAAAEPAAARRRGRPPRAAAETPAAEPAQPRR